MKTINRFLKKGETLVKQVEVIKLRHLVVSFLIIYESYIYKKKLLNALSKAH